MADHLEDDEQVEALKRWWTENGRSTLVAVALAVGGTVGWQQYQGWEIEQGALAADAWAEIDMRLNVDDASQQAAGERLALDLLEKHPNTAQAQFAAMALAKKAVDDGDLTSAEGHLRLALALGDSQSELGQLIQVRLARVLVASGDEMAAIAILTQIKGALPASYATALGDLHLAAGREEEALDAYIQARTATLDLGNPPGLLDAKITSLQSRLVDEERPS